MYIHRLIMLPHREPGDEANYRSKNKNDEFGDIQASLNNATC